MVLGALLLVLFVLMYSCSGTESSSAAQGHILYPETAPSAASPRVSAAAARAVPSDRVSPAAVETPSRPSATATSSAQRCVDEDIQLAVLPVWSNGAVSVAPVQLTLKVKNVSDHTCTRDVGADAQELYVSDGSGTVWSSDFCEPIAHGVDVRTFAPGVEAAFYVTWDGTKATALHACSGTVSPGAYQLVGRLNDKSSDPVSIRIERVG